MTYSASHDAYPTWLLDQRLAVNSHLSAAIDAAFEDKYFSNEVKRCTLPGRKIRSILFTSTTEQLGVTHPERFVSDVVFAIELSHGASVLVDDVVDGDQYRHGAPATEALWGQTKSILFAHLLASAALRRVAPYPELQGELVRVYERMARGEIHDLMLPSGSWMQDGYSWRVSDKTTAMFAFALAASVHFASDKLLREQLVAIGHEFGVMYQCCNDYFDWQIHNVDKRHGSELAWPITFSLPLAVYLQQHNAGDITAYLDRRTLNPVEWREFLSAIWSDNISERCLKIIAGSHHRLLSHIQRANLPSQLRALYIELALLVQSELFWYHSYDMHEMITNKME